MTTERTQVGRQVEAALGEVLAHVRAALSTTPPQSVFLRSESV